MSFTNVVRSPIGARKAAMRSQKNDKETSNIMKTTTNSNTRICNESSNKDWDPGQKSFWTAGREQIKLKTSQMFLRKRSHYTNRSRG